MARSLLMLLLTSLVFLSITALTFAEIRVYDINSDKFNQISVANNNWKTLLIDSFEFNNQGGGRIEVNVSQIYLSNSIPNLNLSKIGFFIFDTFAYKDYSIINDSVAGFSFDNLSNGANSFDFVFSQEEQVQQQQQQQHYTLYFINHLSAAELQFSMVVITSMYNLQIIDNNTTMKNYLSANKVLLPRLHFGFLLLYLCLFFISLRKYLVYIKLKKLNHRLRIRIVILVVLIFKVLSLFTHLVWNIFIKHFGYSQGLFVTMLAYASVLFSEVPFPILMTLISCGWSYLKPSLNLKHKSILIVVVIFHTLMNVDELKYTQIRPNFEQCHWCLEKWWVSRFLFDIAVLLYCAHKTFYFLRDSGDVEGKALPTLVKIQKFRTFFILCFSFHSVKYFYTIFQTFSPIWATVLLGEAITFGFYVFVEYMFWSDFLSLKLRIDDDLEYAAAEFLDREKELLF